MGVRSVLLRSIPESANALYKFHDALCSLETWNRDNVNTYSIMDGAYVMTQRRDTMENFLKEAFRRLANGVINELITESESGEKQVENPRHALLPRAGLAYGPMLHPEAFSEDVSEIFTDYEELSNIPMGMPMVQALQCESAAPPFGIYVHESARGFSPLKEEYQSGSTLDTEESEEKAEGRHISRLRFIWYKWFYEITNNETVDSRGVDSEEDLVDLTLVLEKYFKYSLQNHHRIPDYPPEKITHHIEQTAQYFPQFEYDNLEDELKRWG